MSATPIAIDARRAVARRILRRRAFARIAEPATMATDYLLAALALYLGLRLLGAASHADSPAVLVVGVAFLTTACAAALGGTAHGFSRTLGERKRSVWRATIILLGVGASLLLAGTALAALDAAAAGWVVAGVAAKLAAYVAWMRRHDEFRFVVYDQALSLAGMLVIVCAPGSALSATSTRCLVLGVMTCLAAGVVQRSQVRLWSLNQNDLSHVVQLAGLWFLYRAGMSFVAA